MNSSFAEQYTSFLRHTLFFSKLSEEDICHFSAHLRVKHYPKGKILLQRNDKAEKFLIIHKGWVKLFRETRDGNESITALLTVGGSFGEEVVFEEGLYSVSAEALEDSTVIEFPAHILQKTIRNNNQLALNMLSSMVEHIHQQNVQIESLKLFTAPQRIGCFLLRQPCLNQFKQQFSITLPLDKSLIASWLGMKPETFSRALWQLQPIGVDVTGMKVIIHNRAALERYCCVSCSSIEECDARKKQHCLDCTCG